MKKIFLPLTAFLLFVGFSSIIFAQPSGTGTSGDPYLIASLSDLNWISQNSAEWTKVFKQTADIDASTTSSQDGGNGFIPIGNATTVFTGSYDGQTYKITGLYINRNATDNVSMFGYASNGATITNVKLENVNITGSSRVGGLIGSQYRDASSGSVCTVTNCYATGSVTSTSGNAGGLIGYQRNASTSKCYAVVSVSGPSYVGGLIGRQYGDVALAGSTTCTDCYSTGAVSGTGSASYNIGGLIGHQQQATATNCYSTGSVTGMTDIGGLIGIKASSSATTNCFWDNETSGQPTVGVATGSSTGVTGKTTAEMKTQSTFLSAGWDAATWNMGDAINSGYPYLKWQNPGGTALPVEIASFTATALRSSAQLMWKTATEVNCYGFEVERRRIQDSEIRSQKAEWTRVGFVQGRGTSNSPHEYSFADADVPSGRYAYRIKQIDHDNAFAYYGNAEVVIGQASRELSLGNYPNPFNPSTTIEFTVPEDGLASLKIYNAIGQLVATAFDGEVQAGYVQKAVFNASRLSSGVYFSRLEMNGKSLIKKIALMK